MLWVVGRRVWKFELGEEGVCIGAAWHRVQGQAKGRRESRKKWRLEISYISSVAQIKKHIEG